MSTKQIKPTSGNTRRIQRSAAETRMDSKSVSARIKNRPSNSRHLQEQIETKRISGRRNWIPDGQQKGENQSKTRRADS
jgi:hypothetical protein